MAIVSREISAFDFLGAQLDTAPFKVPDEEERGVHAASTHTLHSGVQWSWPPWSFGHWSGV